MTTITTETPVASYNLFVCSTWSGPLTLRVGDEVGVVGPGYFPGPPTVCRVERITHKGKRCRVDGGREFNERGRETGDRSQPARLIPAEKARQDADPRNKLKAFTHALDRLRNRLSAITRVHAESEEFQPLTVEERAELLAAIERL